LQKWKKANKHIRAYRLYFGRKHLKYISNKLSSAEKHEVEKHLIDCDMCSDAAEGLADARR